MPKRPQRARILDETGRLKSLPAGEDQFISQGTGHGMLVLGLGPEPGLLAELLPETGVSWLEAPQFTQQMGKQWRAAIPSGWRELTPQEAMDQLASGERGLLYTPAPRLFPSFWSPVLAAASLPSPPEETSREVWMPAREDGLLVREMADAFTQSGYEVRLLDPAALPRRLPALLRERAPELFFSINFLGLDSLGETHHLLRRAGTAVAAWCVDNPFHLLSSLRASFWRDLLLCVTDDWFASPLLDHGAGQVLHLPLAAWPNMFENLDSAPNQDVDGRLAFVGRSAFPDKKGFFAGVRLPLDDWTAAQEKIARGNRPDFGWWAEKLNTGQLWPGRQARNPGYGAEESGRAWRAACLRAAVGETPLTVFGDTGWRDVLPEDTDFRGPVDYYGPLAAIYAQAQAVLGCTSPLLPAGLTQRHFDVWAAGGLLLSDATPGLSLFPDELTREISFAHPGRIGGMFQRFEHRPAERADLIRAWRELILAEHTYAHRAATVLDCLGG